MAKIYHERQVSQLCALHVLNNLFQSPKAFSKSELDAICYELSPGTWINPHKSAIGLGNYDVNVLMSALQKRGLKTLWFDKRRDVCQIDSGQVFGFILNVPSNYKILGVVPSPLHSKHWLAIKQADDGKFYNLDSNLKDPEMIGDTNDLRRFFQGVLSSKDKELLIIVPDNCDSPYVFAASSE